MSDENLPKIFSLTSAQDIGSIPEQLFNFAGDKQWTPNDISSMFDTHLPDTLPTINSNVAMQAFKEHFDMMIETSYITQK